jgi:hypothetical protein
MTHSNRRYNATLTTNTDAPIGRAGGMGTKRSYQEQLGKSQAKVNPKILASLQELCRVCVWVCVCLCVCMCACARACAHVCASVRLLMKGCSEREGCATVLL